MNSLNTIAVYIGNNVIYWSSIVIVLGVMAGFCLAYSVYTAHSGRGSTMFAAFAFSLFFGVLISRLVHFYTHQQNYDGIMKALFEYGGGSFFLPGAVLGVWIGAEIAHNLGFAESAAGIRDAFAPGMALTFALIRLSSLFTSSCRGKMTVSKHSLQHLPLASAVTTASGKVEYRFATFFITFLLLLIAMILLLVFYYRHHRDYMKSPCEREGHVFRLFLVLYGVIELVMDSTRNDSTFPYFTFFKTLNRFGSFVSLTQLFAAISILIVFIRYSKYSVAADGRKAKHWILWILFTVSLTGVGLSEYFVQRHGDMYMICYAVMSACAVLMAGTVAVMYLFCRIPRKKETDEYEE